MSLKSHARSLRNALLRRAVLHADAKLPGGVSGFLLREKFVNEGAGAAYGVGPRDRAELWRRFDRINENVTSATNTVVHAALAHEILSISPDVKGDVVEAGCYKGASSAALSLLCAITGRRLIVCDSFEGLPDDETPLHIGVHEGIYGYLKRGMYAGTLDEVKVNIAAYGDPSVVSFIKGFFSASLRALSEPIVFAFVDVDLESSTRDALVHVWPLLVEGGTVYSDDAADLSCVRPFFDEAWWQARFGEPAPGFVGSGCGLSSFLPSNGYVRKMGAFHSSKYKRGPWLYYPDEAEAPPVAAALPQEPDPIHGVGRGFAP